MMKTVLQTPGWQEGGVINLRAERNSDKQPVRRAAIRYLGVEVSKFCFPLNIPCDSPNHAGRMLVGALLGESVSKRQDSASRLIFF